MTTPTNIVADQNTQFEVTLYTHSGTGYSWYLTGLTGGLALIASVEQQVVPVPGGACRQIFTFLATAAGAGELKFALLRAWEATTPADTRVISVDVHANVAGAMKAAAGHETFVPCVSAECGGENDGQVLIESAHQCHVLKYGHPHNLKYGYPTPPTLYYGVLPTPVARYMAQPPQK